MAKTLKYPMMVTTDDYDVDKGTGHSETIGVGEPVPGWAEKYVEDEWVADETPYGTAAGLDLVADHNRADLVRAMKNLGLEVKMTYSNEQMAALIRHKLFEDDVKAEYGDEYEADAVKDNEALFASTNESGNVNAPDVEKKKSSRTSGSDA